MFNDVVKPAVKDGHGIGDPVLGELEVSAKLKEIMGRNQDIGLELEVFRRDVLPYVREMRGQVPKPIYMATAQFLRGVRETIINEGLDGHSLELSQAFTAIGKWDLWIRNELVLNICSKLTVAKNTSSVRTQLLDELISLWKDITQLRRASEVGQEPKFALPSVQEVLRDAERKKSAESLDPEPCSKTAASRGLASIFLQYPPMEAREILPGLFATVAVISDKRIARASREFELRPLLRLVRAITFNHEMGTDDIHYAFSTPTKFCPSRLAKLRSYTLGQWSHVVEMFASKKLNWDRTGATGQAEAHNMGNGPSPNMFHKQLRTAYRALNHGAMIHIWQSMLASMRQHQSLKVQLRQDAPLFDYWVFVWCASRKLPYLEETLALMRELELEPTIKTYTAMMHGFKMSKDVKMLEGIWNQLAGSGYKLDVVIWTERISGLIELGKAQEGIIAISDMVMTWKQAVEEGRQAQAVQPTIEVVNAAFKGLLRQDPKAAHELLAWAGREGFEPNVRTYNILMGESLRDGSMEDVQKLLRSMQSQNVEPDAATFTIILEQVIGQLKHATSAEQVEAVKHVLADIEGAGIRANLETYGKMLYAIASIANGSEDAIAVVQDHMHSKGFAITPHMVTILIERVMARNPPDINAVRALLKEHNYITVEQGDRTLWERVMSAYAVADETKDAMEIFDELAQKGQPATTLTCLAELMQALIRADELEAARRVVDVVLAHKMQTRDGLDERHWRHHFWFLAKQHGLMSQRLQPAE